MPDFFTLIGCRWSTTLPSMARARLRLSVGMPTRKMDFQIWDLVMLFDKLSIMSPLRGSGGRDESAGIFPLSQLPLELLRLVDDDLAVVRADEDAGTLERPGRRPLEVDAALVVPAAVARALELVLRVEPRRRAAEVGADGDQGVDPAAVVDDPDAVLVDEPGVHHAGLEVFRLAHLEAGGRLEEHVGKHEPPHGRDAAADGHREPHPGHRGPGEEAAAGDAVCGGTGGSRGGPGGRRG